MWIRYVVFVFSGSVNTLDYQGCQKEIHQSFDKLVTRCGSPNHRLVVDHLYSDLL